MAGRPILALQLSRQERAELERHSGAKHVREAQRATIILHRADGLSQEQTARKLGCSNKTVQKWTTRYRFQGIRGLIDAPGRGRKNKSTGPHQSPATRQPDPILPGPAKVPPTKPADEASFRKPKEKEDHPHPSTREQPSEPPAKPVMRSIARIANVSTTTVSRVLSNHPNVHPDLRQRVLEAAQNIGYRPDPELRKLMVHLRKQKVKRLQGVICSLEAKAWSQATSWYFRSLATGAKSKAEALGFAWDTFPLEEFFYNPLRSTRALYHRGVEGILLPPAPLQMYQPYQDYLQSEHDLEKFSVVIATSTVIEPAFRSVIPHYFRNMVRLCEALLEKGYRRLGLAIPEDLDKRVAREYSGGFAAFHLTIKQSMLPPFLYTKLNSTASDDRRKLREWFHDFEPDALIIGSSILKQDFVRILNVQPGTTGIASVSVLDKSSAGIDELPARIGSIAVEALGSMIIHHEKGIPPHPTITTVKGDWQDGPLLPSRINPDTSAARPD